MQTVAPHASDSDLIGCIEEWVGLLAAGSFVAAAQFLCPPAEVSRGEPWTAESLETYIADYGWWEPLDDGRRMHVTSAAGAGAGGDLTPHRDVIRYDDRPPRIEFSLPLNGEWSDLTAVFHLVEVDGAWAFDLYDLRVF
ncbi:hypothetical protein [Catellatospora sp. IY07-71]|uniref:hypothetical protein n=1 Tax=Catellatospora sp. IY07-71 TaxID=2728827 RepID=UPI001BB38AE1|nr:hypothetical protein [Catellatospora sp. IY07-71]